MVRTSLFITAPRMSPRKQCDAGNSRSPVGRPEALAAQTSIGIRKRVFRVCQWLCLGSAGFLRRSVEAVSEPFLGSLALSVLKPVLIFSLLIFASWPATTVVGNDWLQFQENAAHHGRAANAVEPPYQLRWVWYGEDNVVVVRRPLPAGNGPKTTSRHRGVALVHDARSRRGRTRHFRRSAGQTLLPRFSRWQHDLATAVSRRTGACRRDPQTVRRSAAESDCRCLSGWQDLRARIGSGQVRWSVSGGRPFVTSPTISHATVYCGGVDGILYAMDAGTGTVRWRFDAGPRSANRRRSAQGRVFFGAENMVFYALDAASGQLLWKTAPGQLTGQSFRNTWPVVVGDKVMTFQILVDGMAEYVMEASAV